MNTNKPDLKAPRFRKSVFGTLNQVYYKYLRSKVSVPGMSDQDIKRVVLACNRILWETAIEKRDGVELPSQIGNLFIGTCQTARTKNTDYARSIALEHDVNHKNWDTDNKMAKIFYTNQHKYRFLNYEIWGFTAIRNFKRAVAHSYPENWKRYIEVDSAIRISKIFRKNYINMLVKKQALNIQDYDELALD